MQSTVVRIQPRAPGDPVVVGTIVVPTGVPGIAGVNQPPLTFASIAGVPGDNASLQAALDLKAPLASPALTGSPTAATAPSGDNSTRIATTAYVDGKPAVAVGAVEPASPIVGALWYDTNSNRLMLYIGTWFQIA